jgi:hypothetical protein
MNCAMCLHCESPSAGEMGSAPHAEDGWCGDHHMRPTNRALHCLNSVLVIAFLREVNNENKLFKMYQGQISSYCIDKRCICRRQISEDEIETTQLLTKQVSSLWVYIKCTQAFVYLRGIWCLLNYTWLFLS